MRKHIEALWEHGDVESKRMLFRQWLREIVLEPDTAEVIMRFKLPPPLEPVEKYMFAKCCSHAACRRTNR